MNDIPLHIDELDSNGWGKAQWLRPDGLLRAVTVPLSLPAETVVSDLFKCKSKKTTGLVAEVRSVTNPSPFRVQPRCKHFSYCGGCTWQHVEYKKQLEIKEKWVQELFPDCPTHHPIIAAPDVWNYRNKMEFSFGEDLKGQKFLGLMIRSSRGRVFTIEECHLVNPWMAETLQAIYKWWQTTDLLAFYGPKQLGHLRTLTMREASSGDRVIVLCVSGKPEYAIKRAQLDQFLEVCKKVAGEHTSILRIQQVHTGSQTQFFEMRLHGPDTFRQEITVGDNTFEFHLSPSSFFQPNSRQAGVIYERALALANLSQNDVLYDLYAGIGIFGMVASKSVKQVISIELSPDAAYDATENAKRLNLSNVRMIKGDVAQILKEGNLPKADCVIVDPPRTGLGPKACEQVVALKPATICYVSCNPKTQKIDVEQLCKSGYTLTCIQPIDQFAQTIHVENIAILTTYCA